MLYFNHEVRKIPSHKCHIKCTPHLAGGPIHYGTTGKYRVLQQRERSWSNPIDCVAVRTVPLFLSYHKMHCFERGKYYG